jgi:predicted N-formylglutamate amidohydrolase
LTPPTFDALLVTCEHASNAVPARWHKAFAAQPAVLKTHRAWDPGALILASELAAEFNAPLHQGEMTRLMIDLNRRESSKSALSSFTPQDARDELLAYHRKYRDAVLHDALRLKGRLLHVSCHSFTPELKGEIRNAEIGLLYDPRVKLERSAADAWHAALATALPDMRIRRNYPYKGISDGITTWLRKQRKNYAGFEVELNQAFCAASASSWSAVRRAIVESIAKLVR